MVKLRRAAPDDALGILTVMEAAFRPYRHLYTDGCYDATVLDVPRIRHRMEEGPVWVAVTERILGTIGATQHDGWYVRGLGVHPDAQGKGVGRALLDAAVAAGRGDAWLSTTPFLEGSRRLYEAAGFRPIDGPPDLCGTPLVSYGIGALPDR